MIRQVLRIKFLLMVLKYNESKELPQITPVLVTSRGASLAPSHAASRTASPVLSHAGDDPSLPLVLCSLLQREFSGPRSPGRSGSFRRKSRRQGEDQDDENGG